MCVGLVKKLSSQWSFDASTVQCTYVQQYIVLYGCLCLGNIEMFRGTEEMFR